MVDQSMYATDILIVGAGLCGLHTAFALTESGSDFIVIEGRDRVGGRILSLDAEGRVPAETAMANFDLGPTWVWQGQPRITELLVTLGIETFLQHVPGDYLYENESGNAQRIPGFGFQGDSLRVRGGMGRVTGELARRIPSNRVRNSSTLRRLSRTAYGVEALLECDDGIELSITARIAVVTIPPRLAANLDLIPPLPAPLHSAMHATPTWMAGNAKLVALYERAFWREGGLSGEASSRVGPLVEIHDASPSDSGPHALFGFLGIPAHTRRQAGQEAVTAAAIRQLERLFGERAGNPVRVLTKDWADDALTAAAHDRVPLAAHPDYGFAPETLNLWDGHLILSGTETARENGGLLEGALEASNVALGFLVFGRP